MGKDLISKKTRYEFREYFVGRTLREIEQEFDAADVPLDESYEPKESGQRRCLVEKYYRRVDWTRWNDVRRILEVYANVLTELESHASRSMAQDVVDHSRDVFNSLRKWIERDGFVYSDGRLIPREDVVQLPEVHDVSIRFDAPELRRQVDRMRNAVDDDPALAIGTAKELIETTCKTILDDRGIEHSQDTDLIGLVKLTRQTLGLMPADIPDTAKGAEVVKRLLSNLGSVAQGLGELRNLYGTGHGRKGKAKGISPRHARLAVGSSATLAVFLFETHQERE